MSYAFLSSFFFFRFSVCLEMVIAVVVVTLVVCSIIKQLEVVIMVVLRLVFCMQYE